MCCRSILLLLSLLSLSCDGRIGDIVVIVSPSDGDYVSGEIEIELTVPSTIGEVTVSIGGKVIANLTEPPYVVILDTTELADGPIELKAQGHYQIATATIAVDNIAPTAILAEPRASYIEDIDASLHILMADDNGISELALTIVGDANTLQEGFENPASDFEVPLDLTLTANPAPQMARRSLQVRVQVTDNSGRVTELNDSFTLSSRQLWSQSLAALSFGHPVVDVDGFLWVGATKTDDSRSTLFKLNPLTGGIECSLGLPGRRIYSLAEANDLMVFGTSNSMRAVKRSDCSVAWNHNNPQRVYRARPVFDPASNLIYATSDAGDIVPLNLSGASAGPILSLGEVMTSAPTIANGQLFAATNAGNVYGFNTATGTELWPHVETAGGIDGDTALAGTTLYVASADSHLYGFNIVTGEKTFQVLPDGFQLRSAPAVAPDGTILVASLGRKLYAYDASGEEKWSADIGILGSKSRFSVVADEEGNGWTIYLASAQSPTEGSVTAIDAEGRVLWDAPLGGEVQVAGAGGKGRYFAVTASFEAFGFKTGPALHRD